MIQKRERIVLEILEKLPKDGVVLIGGYAINAYTAPRFSVDCDLVVLDNLEKIEQALREEGFEKAGEGDVPYGQYIRYVSREEDVSFDLLNGAVEDRNTGIIFNADMFRRHSDVRTTVGRANPIHIELRIVDPELLFAMKFVSARKQDIRDLFMLAGEDLDRDVVTALIQEKCDADTIKKHAQAVRKAVDGEHYRDSLQGPYGKIPDAQFNRCNETLHSILNELEKGAA
ncbi:MAG: nucleotidyl transferase AbiEii/AbiGii toxin family protein [Candidatus Nanohaloarchaea archaeon]|nr:nucleotidyl transferase AbiEii/AbiGii toxin family protein [Candidatus Nanohaloarchaea archaeon]